MTTLDEVLAAARSLGPEDQARLARALGAGAPAAVQFGGPFRRQPAPHSVEWVKAERGHAVLATDTGPSEADIPPGPEAIAGMWADRSGGQP